MLKLCSDFIPSNYIISKVHLLMVERDQGHTIKHLYRYCHVLVYLLRGKLSYTDEATNKTIILSPGEFALFPKFCTITAQYLENNTKIFCFFFDTLEDKKVCDHISSFQENFQLSSMLQITMDYFEHHKTTDEKYYFSVLYYILSSLHKETPPEDQRYLQISPALDHMLRNFSENLKISDYAKMCAICESSFRHIFMQVVGVSPILYRNKLRLEHAKQLIESGEYTVSEAASLSGFQNLSFFCREYKKYFGKCCKYEKHSATTKQ